MNVIKDEVWELSSVTEGYGILDMVKDEYRERVLEKRGKNAIDLFVYVDTFTKSESSETYQTTEDPDQILPSGGSGWFVFF